MDRDKLIGELAIKHQILLDKTDPIFALVALNELVLSEMVDKANELSSNVEVNLSPIMERLNYTLGLIQDKGEITNEQLVRNINLLRTEASEIIKAAKEATSTAGNEQIEASVQAIAGAGNQAKTEISIEKSSAKEELAEFVIGLKQQIGEDVENAVRAKAQEPIKHALGALKESITDLGKEKDKLKDAAKQNNIALWQRASYYFAAAVLGSVLTLGVGKLFGVFDGPVSKIQVEDLQKTQDNISMQLDKLLDAQQAKRK